MRTPLRSIAIRAGEIARTIELTDMVYVDVDASGDPLGIEFVSADELVPFLRRLSAVEQSHEWHDLVPSEVRELFSANAA